MVKELIPLHRPWFNTLIPRSHDRTSMELRHGWLHSGYTSVDVTIKIGIMSATVQQKYVRQALSLW